MTDRELMHQALDALETVFMPHHPAVIALRDRLVQSEQGPVAWQGVHDHTDLYYRKPPQADVRPLYINPRRQWVGLTDEEIESAWKDSCTIDNGKGANLTNQPFYHLVKFAESKLKEKNGG